MTASATPRSRPAWATIARVVLGLLPLWLLLYELVAIPGTADLLGANPPALVGLPAGILTAVLALVVMSLGVIVLWRSRPAVALVAFALLTMPATFLMIVGPAFGLPSWGF